MKRTASSTLAFGLLVLFGCASQSEPAPSASASAPVPEAAPAPAAAPKKTSKTPRLTKAQRDAQYRTFEAQLGRLDSSLQALRTHADAHPHNRMTRERIAATHLQRARMSGSYDDYAAAERALEDAFERQPSGETSMLRARLHYSLHRIPEATADFSAAATRIRRTPDGAASMAAFEGNLALQTGRYDEAAERFAASLKAKRTMSNLSSYAVFLWKTGDFDGAEEHFREALTHYHGKPTEPIAWIHLNLGLLDLDRGRLDDALAHYREAEQHVAGYWLIDEHIAEILTLRGETEQAKALYADIIERTNNPEFMDAMAGIAAEEGRAEDAAAWTARARARYDAQLARYPEAAYGHALEHMLEFGEPSEALTMAQKNYDLRPGGEAAVLLAQAQLAAGDAKAADRTLAQTLKSRFRSADLFVTAASIAFARGKDSQAETLLTKARGIDPTASL
ncbi:MAG: tetratricopeptide repeat protein [Myxococcota bacterium]